MKLSKKSIQKAKIELVDFSDCEKYLLKYMEKNKAMKMKK